MGLLSFVFFSQNLAWAWAGVGGDEEAATDGTADKRGNCLEKVGLRAK